MKRRDLAKMVEHNQSLLDLLTRQVTRLERVASIPTARNPQHDNQYDFQRGGSDRYSRTSHHDR
jgi:hypothetical protein